MEEIAEEVSLADRFVMNYYKVLPTDPKFQDLREGASDLLFYIFLNTPNTPMELAHVKEQLADKLSLKADDDAKKAADKIGIDLESAIADIKGVE